MLFSALLLFSCEKAKYESTGTITEPDYRKCMCCGGYFIEIEGTQYNFQKSELPVDFSFNDNQLPMQVELNFKPKADECSGSGIHWINILKIRMIK